MFNGVFIASIVAGFAQAIKEYFEPVVPANNLANKYPEPHRDPVDGKIVIENCEQYYQDVQYYGAYQAQQWVKQGKYNLSKEELKKEEERIEANYKRLYALQRCV